MNPPPSPTWPGLAWAAAPMLGAMAVLAWRGLGQVRPLAVGSARLVVQMSLLGLVLGSVFASDSPALVLAVALIMLAASAYTVNTRQRGKSRTLRIEAFGAMLLGAGIVMAVATRLALGVTPWYDPRTILPMLGMILGNSVNGVALAAERLESELRGDRDRVEWRLTLGATAREAATPALRAAVQASLTPTINGMMIAGIVAIPGMMTGQILAGADVDQALRYQILLNFLIAGTVAISTLVMLSLRLKHYFTPAHQLRPESTEY